MCVGGCLLQLQRRPESSPGSTSSIVGRDSRWPGWGQTCCPAEPGSGAERVWPVEPAPCKVMQPKRPKRYLREKFSIRWAALSPGGICDMVHLLAQQELPEPCRVPIRPASERDHSQHLDGKGRGVNLPTRTRTATEIQKGAGEGDWWVKRLLCKCENLSSNPLDPHPSWPGDHASVI